MRGALRTLLMMGTTAVLLASGVTAAVADEPVFEDCPSGWVCISEAYVEGSAVNIRARFYTYGYHNLSNILGRMVVINEQTDGATVTLCYGYNGTRCTGPTVQARDTWYGDMTPINSVRLSQRR